VARIREGKSATLKNRLSAALEELNQPKYQKALTAMKICRISLKARKAAAATVKARQNAATAAAKRRG